MIRKIPKILLVEDDAENRLAMSKILQGAGYDVVEKDNGQDALDYINAKSVDIVVTDMRLPVVDGVVAWLWVAMNRPSLFFIVKKSSTR